MWEVRLEGLRQYDKQVSATGIPIAVVSNNDHIRHNEKRISNSLRHAWCSKLSLTRSYPAMYRQFLLLVPYRKVILGLQLKKNKMKLIKSIDRQGSYFLVLIRRTERTA